MTTARPPQAHRAEVPLDTLGALADRGHRMFGSWLDFARRYDPKLGGPATEPARLSTRRAKTRATCTCPAMIPISTARRIVVSGSRRTEIRLLPPPKGGSGHEEHSANNGRGA